MKQPPASFRTLSRIKLPTISNRVPLVWLLLRIVAIGFVLLFSVGTIASPNSIGSDTTQTRRAQADRKAPPGMAWTPGGTFLMGTNDKESSPNERPAHLVQVQGFWMDVHDVTSAEFAKFVEATGYVTTAERPINWKDLKKGLPPGTPKPDDSALAPGSLVFTPTSGPVLLNDLSAWWRWVKGANWRHPEGPGSSIQGRENHPVSWYDAVAYAHWAANGCLRKLSGNFPPGAGWNQSATSGWRLPAKRSVHGQHLAGVFPVRDTDEDGIAGTFPVGSFPANGYGLYEMAGNVWQWCSDWYRFDAHIEAASQNVCRDPSGPAASYDPGDPYSSAWSKGVPSFATRPTAKVTARARGEEHLPIPVRPMRVFGA